jgi:hypothetical protein
MAHQLARAEIVCLFEVAGLVEHVRHPHTIDSEIARQGIRRGCGGFDAPFGMFAYKPAHQGHACKEGNVTDAQSNQAVAHIGRQLFFAMTADWFGTDRLRHGAASYTAKKDSMKRTKSAAKTELRPTARRIMVWRVQRSALTNLANSLHQST